MIPSPPQEAEQFRGKTLTPESPKPVHYPSPSNIPILVEQMDPNFHETAMGQGPPSYTPNPHQPTDTPSYYGDTFSYNAQAGGAANGHDGYARTLGYAGGSAPSAQDTSAIHNFAPQQHAAASYSDAASTPQHDDRSSYPNLYDLTARSPYPGTGSQALPAHGHPEQANQSLGAANGGGVDFQALLDNLSTPVQSSSSNNGNTASQPSQASQTHGQISSSSALPPAPNLPPRPPPQAKPASHPNYAPEDDIRSFHPHSRKPPAAASYRAPGGLQPLMTANAQGNAPTNSGYSQQPPSSATQSNQSPSTPGFMQRESNFAKPDSERKIEFEAIDDEDARWPPEINRIYEQFLEEERKFVTDGQWDQFPNGSRLFIGNLPTEKVTKRDIFHRFYRHGRLAQISIKQAYGFVQFLDVSSCRSALQSEQGQSIRGRKMHLEVSKPQRNTKVKTEDGGNNGRGAGNRRRSRSPDYTRGGTGPQGGRSVDRYTSQPNGSSPRDRDFRRNRDDYRPGRSPSPRGGGRGGRGRDRSHDRYDGRRRSRSRSPGFGRGRFRSPSPPRRDIDDDDLPLPRRAPHAVPDVQVIVVDDLDRNFISWVESSFQQAGLHCDVCIISARLSEPAVVRRQILEGVLAVSKLDRKSMETSKIQLTVFDRRAGNGSVRFDEYSDLDPQVAAQVVVNAKRTHTQPVAPPTPIQYGLPPAGYGMPQPPAFAQPPPFAQPGGYPPQNQGPPPTSNANLSNLISSLDTNGLHQLLGAMNQPNAPQPPPPQAGISPDLARLLSASGAQPNHGYGQPPQPVMPPQPAQAQGQPDMNEIMAQLAKYRR